jgi:uncharacterized damage-inducible protein DinB
MTVTDLVGSVRASRKHFWKHIDGLTDAQWDWKPYPECKNACETLAHLVTDDRAALAAVESDGEPDYESFAETERDPARLRVLLTASHEALCVALLAKFADAPLDTTLSVWGVPMPLGTGISHFCSEDFFHAGQISFIRMATDPTWDYYSAIYGAH